MSTSGWKPFHLRRPYLLAYIGARDSFVESLAALARARGVQVAFAADAASFGELQRASAFDGVVLDLRTTPAGTLDLVRRLAISAHEPAVVAVLSGGAPALCAELLQCGAADCVHEPLDGEVAAHRIFRALELREAARAEEAARHAKSLDAPLSAGVFVSSAMRQLRERALAVAQRDCRAVLVRGDLGTGVSEMCRFIHALSPRYEGPLIAFDCRHPDPLQVYGELFGFERGVMPGESHARRGLLERASAWTLLLDEVTALPLTAQEALVGVFERGVLRRLGGSEEIATGVRTLAASWKNVEGLLSQGRVHPQLGEVLLREKFEIPPLRERPEDIRALAEHACALACRRYGARTELSPAAHQALLAHPWPGNEEELSGAVSQAVLLHREGPLHPEDIPLSRGPWSRWPAAAEEPSAAYQRRGAPSQASLESVERAHIARILDACGGNRTRTAMALGIARSTLIRKITELKIQEPKNGDDD